ncbi:MAG: ImmA/IrrE family metallo-endopeptidase, partial [Anaerolineaceae bacterium]
MLNKFDFSRYFYSPEELAQQVLQVFNHGGDIEYPIDPFKLLSEFNIVYQFRDFDKLEGIYIVPEDENDIPIVGINQKRPVARQRFTAAHEISHHIKDKTNIFCPINGNKNKIEKFADQFAAALLMPIDELKKISDRYVVNGYVEFENILRIADYFGVSFESCVYRLAYKLHRISGDTKPEMLKRRIQSFKPQNKRVALGLANHDLPLLRNIINSYELFIKRETAIVWNKFKINFVYHEN